MDTVIWVKLQAIIRALRRSEAQKGRKALADIFKATVCFRLDWLGLPCLVQLLTWLLVCRNTVIFGTLKEKVRNFV